LPGAGKTSLKGQMAGSGADWPGAESCSGSGKTSPGRVNISNQG